MHTRPQMKIALDLDEALIRAAAKLTRLRAKTDVIHEGLRALIARESAHRLAALGGTMSSARVPPRRRGRPSPST